MAPTLNWFFWTFVAFYGSYVAIELLLNWLNLKELNKHQNDIPNGFQNHITKEQYQKSIAYTIAKTRFAMFSLGFHAVITWLLILAGFFFYLDIFLIASVKHIWSRSILYPVCLGLILYFINIPLTIYHQFVLEERFGFNKSTIRTFVADQIKTMLISLILGVPLLALLFWLVDAAGTSWWILGFAFIMAFQFLVAAIFPVLLAPLFNKFTPLSDGELKTKIEQLAQKLNFKNAGIFTIDGSKRSSHSNAYFAGLGKTRRIVLFDTLIQNLTTDEIVSVIAHEMGHNIRKHIVKNLVIGAAITFASMYVLNFCLTWPAFFYAFGVPYTSAYIGFTLFALFASVFTFWLGPWSKMLSRKFEYEADAFSIQTTGDKANMSSALIKLSKDNLANLTPHPWYVFYHYSHPTTLQRIEAIRANAKH